MIAVTLSVVTLKDYCPNDCICILLQGLGTFHWMAPELIAAGRCTEKADIFSFGVVLYEIVTAEQPIRGRMKPVKYDNMSANALCCTARLKSYSESSTCGTLIVSQYRSSVIGQYM